MTKRVLAAAALAAFGAILLPASASAASFNCALAKSADEKAVCGNAKLSALDSQMGGLWYAYSRVPMLMGSNGNRADDAQAFLATRRACGGKLGCLVQAYNARIAALQQGIDAAMKQFAALQNGG